MSEVVGRLGGVADVHLHVVDPVKRHEIGFLARSRFQPGRGRWRHALLLSSSAPSLYDSLANGRLQAQIVAYRRISGWNWTESTSRSLRCFARTPGARSRTSARGSPSARPR